MQFYSLIQTKQIQWQKKLALLSLLLLLVSGIYLLVGDVTLSLFSPWRELQQQILWQLRIPRLLAAMVIGAALALSGASLQVLLSNPLAEPGIIGISGGASLGMVLLLFLVPTLVSPSAFMLVAVLGSLIFTCILVGVGKMMHLTTARLLLIGVALGILSSSVVTWAFYFSDNFNLRLLMYWLMGSVAGVSWSQLSLSLLMLPAMLWLLRQSRQLDLLMLGEAQAQLLGVNINRLRWQLIGLIALLVGCSVALAGVIGFVGLVIPHLIRLWCGSENRYLLPMSAVAGATLLVLADLLSRTALSAAELPLGVMTTTLGAPVFIWMLLTQHDKY